MKVCIRSCASTYDPVQLITGLMAAVLVFFVVSHVRAHELNNKGIASLKRAVVIVTTYDNHGCPLLQGSGFFIAPDRIVTNLHVISHANEIHIETFARKIFTVQTIIATDVGSDLALLQVKGLRTNDVLQVKSATPAEGDSIILLSNPLGSQWKVSHGRVGRLWLFESIGSRLQITADIFPGSSGGPVLNQQGQVVGIAVMRIDSADDLNFAVPAGNLRTLQVSARVAGNRDKEIANQLSQPK